MSPRLNSTIDSSDHDAMEMDPVTKIEPIMRDDGSNHEIGQNIEKPGDFGLKNIPKLLVCDVWSHDQSLVKITLKTLADQAYGFSVSAVTNAKEVHRCGGHSIVLAVLRMWYFQPEIQSNGMRLLATLVFKACIRESISEMGGAIECALLAMRNFPLHEGVQRQGCNICWGLAYCPKSRSSIAGSDTLKIILAAMTNFPDTLWIQKGACGCFLVLCSQEKFKTPMIRAGCVTALAATFERCKTKDTPLTEEEISILQTASSALKQLL